MKQLIILFFVAASVTSCTGPENARSDSSSPVPGGETPSLDLARQNPDVHSVQLYAFPDEAALPILHLGREDRLTLAFDLLESSGRPLAVHFYHTDRNWARDWSASRFLSTFDKDQIISFDPSMTTRVSYTHYEYEFPNDVIDFDVSGNYILRVTEINDDGAVLFERPFFVTEQAAASEFRFNTFMRPGNQPPGLVPVLKFSPPQALTASAFDFNTCFIRNSRFTERRCTDQPLRRSESLQFELHPRAAYDGRTTHYFLDLGNLATTGQINGINLGVTPPAVWMDTDFARFEDVGYGGAMHGQSIIGDAVEDVAQPHVQGEYLNVHFSYVPTRRVPYTSPIYISGSFNGWAEDDAYSLEWNAEERQYEGNFLIKQGKYEYRYGSPNPAVQRELNQYAFGEPALFTGMVYYRDARLGTDRLVGVTQRIAR